MKNRRPKRTTVHFRISLLPPPLFVGKGNGRLKNRSWDKKRSSGKMMEKMEKKRSTFAVRKTLPGNVRVVQTRLNFSAIGGGSANSLGPAT